MIEAIQSIGPVSTLLISGLSTAVVAILMAFARMRNELRSRELEKVAVAYEKFLSALDRLPDDDTYMSEDMRDFINLLAENIQCESFADTYAERLCVHLDAKPKQRSASMFAEELDRLEKLRPELARNFEDLVSSAGFILAFRFEGPAKKVRLKLTDLYLREQEQPDFQALTDFKGSDWHHGDNHAVA
ncbi:hypothetical protein D1224_09385 [Henriciella barbarensis]|uniref:Uncharacterized protein n=1 Tax=Henriciella barbarensis TaxID=86342 RepID=A0A399QZU8_9PROT|nr:hypothetical protein [Henriciella barbarensis]RIJ24428.1 hypothetical protein D1224_09385 [Henriciella barbarensis]